jgi:hypothetical protein
VTLGLCTQIDLDAQVSKASARRKQMEEDGQVIIEEDTLKPADDQDGESSNSPTTLDEFVRQAQGR